MSIVDISPDLYFKPRGRPLRIRQSKSPPTASPATPALIWSASNRDSWIPQGKAASAPNEPSHGKPISVKHTIL